MTKPKLVTFETAQQMIEYLSPLNPEWENGKYIFRGQPKEEYKLTPSICRVGKGSFAHGSPDRDSDRTVGGQVKFEFKVLKKFLDGCDQSGLPLPGYTESLKRTISEIHDDLDNYQAEWPDKSVYEMLAIAQHYDVPTRLLDWTTRSFVACYFAASSAEFEFDDQEFITVWALDTTYAKQWKTIKIISPPGGTSRNQAAQSGLFTVHSIIDREHPNTYKTEALEEVDEIYIGQNTKPLIKFTLPLEEAPELLRLCSLFGVDGSTLFPGYHGVAKMVRDWAQISIGVTPSEKLLAELLDSSLNDPYDD